MFVQVGVDSNCTPRHLSFRLGPGGTSIIILYYTRSFDVYGNVFRARSVFLGNGYFADSDGNWAYYKIVR